MKKIFVNPPKLIFGLIWACALFSCNADKKTSDKKKDKISKQDELYFKASEQSKFEAKIAEDIPAKIVGSWDGVCSKAFRLEDGLKPTSVKEIHEVYPDRDSKSFIVFYLGEDCKRGKEVFALTVDIKDQAYSEDTENNNISVTANIEDVSFEIVNIPGNQTQKDLILQMFNQKSLCQISDWKIAEKRSIAGSECMGMKVPEKGRFYLNNYWILNQNMKAMLSLNPIHKDEVKLIEENQLFDQKPFSFLRKTKERTAAEKPQTPEPGQEPTPTPELKLSGTFTSSCVRDNSIDLYKTLNLNRITTIDFDNRLRTDTYYLPSELGEKNALVLNEDVYDCEESAKFLEVKTGLLATLDNDSIVFSYNLNSNVRRLVDVNRAISYTVPVDPEKVLDITVWKEDDPKVHSCEKRIEWKQCGKSWLRSGNSCQKTCNYSAVSREYKVYLPANYLLDQNKVCGVSDWNKGSKSVSLSQCEGLSFDTDKFVISTDGRDTFSLNDGNADYKGEISKPQPSPEDPNNEDKELVLSSNWQSSETDNASGFDVTTTTDLKLKDSEKGFFSYTPILNLASISNRILFDSVKIDATDKTLNSKKVWNLTYSVSKAVAHIKSSNSAYDKLLLQNYSKVCKNVDEVKINNEFSIRGARCAGFYIPEGDETHSVEFYINSAGKLVLLLPEENIYFVKK